MLGGQSEQLENALKQLNDHENRIVRLENKADSCDDLHRKGKYLPTSKPVCLLAS